MYVNAREMDVYVRHFREEDSASRQRTGTDRLSEWETERRQLAEHYADYLHGQTGVHLVPPSAGNVESLRASFERLDIALAQLADLAAVYGAEHRSDIEPLTIPTAVLAGEYLRVGTAGRWMEPAFDGDTNLMLVTGDGVAVDMDGLARTALMSHQPALSALVERLIST